MPTRFCLKKIGPSESNLISTINIRNKGDKIINPSKDRITSIIRFIFKYKALHPSYKNLYTIVYILWFKTNNIKLK